MSSSKEAEEPREIEEDDEPDDWSIFKLQRSEASTLTVAVRDKRIYTTGCSGTQTRSDSRLGHAALLADFFKPNKQG